MAHRRTPEKRYRDYRRYKKWIREDFDYRCAYCSIHENDYGGYWQFHVDHYRPKGIPRFEYLINEYSNLLYSCSQCNVMKGDMWPSDDPLLDGYGWLDPCEHDLEEHYYYGYKDGVFAVVTLTGVGRWMALSLGLDQIPRLTFRRDIEADHQTDCEILETLRMLLDKILASDALFASSESTSEDVRFLQQRISQLEGKIQRRFEPKPMLALKRVLTKSDS